MASCLEYNYVCSMAANDADFLSCFKRVSDEYLCKIMAFRLNSKKDVEQSFTYMPIFCIFRAVVKVSGAKCDITGLK